MSKSNTDREKENSGKIVNVSKKGQATIPKKLREKHGIETPGKVQFRENEKGEIVIDPVPSIRDFRGAGKKSKDEKHKGTKALKESRKKDKEREKRLTEHGSDE